MEGIDPSSIVPLYYQIKDSIKHKIQTEEWEYNHKLPSEHELAETLEVSVGTVKRALTDLVAEGILKRMKGRGTFVTKMKFGSSWLKKIFLDEENFKIEVKDFSVSQLKPTVKIREKNLKFEKPGLFRIIIKDAEKKVVRLTLLSFENQKLSLSGGAVGKALKNYNLKSQPEITHAFEYLETIEAQGQISELLNIPKGKPVMCLARVSYGGEGKILEYKEDYFFLDRFLINQRID